MTTYRETQRRYRPTRRQLERIVADVLDTLPEAFRSHLENVAIVVEDWPPAERSAADGQDGELLLGLYQGTPYTQRGTGYHLAPPDRITIYRGPILALCSSPAELEREVRDTLLHEIGHYFGLEEHELK